MWGKTTYESVLAWGEEYIKDLDNVDLYIVSSREYVSNDNVVYCKSPNEVIEKMKSKGIEKVLISGGAKLNSAFIKEGLATELILSYNPVIIPNGINLFNNDVSDINLKLKEVKDIGNSMIHVKYEIL